ncbi:type II toxin-antitoxin system RelB/DinJ family antitoxin [Gallaecimonas xiamenensis]|uniref:StaA n=1 Tax=Gallaecimonas xiamenensis 3-C-1 TaxID=745411 RepID=K2JZD4_9GAMM|nr:type II toxin-antitoxin system RelB/DinJ family antitoxin [Gallaecimonas xiamenensis]EKE70640.1 StaA [Gallaecimonas xiamenensis 3-C-1]
MSTQGSEMVRARVDAKLKAEAANALDAIGLTISDAIRVLLTRIVEEGGLPHALATSQESYDRYLDEKLESWMNRRSKLAEPDAVDALRKRAVS